MDASFAKCFFCISCNGHIIDTDLWVLSHPWMPAVNSTWSWYMILFIYYWILFADILLRSIFSSVHQVCDFCFLWHPYVVSVLKYCYPCKVSLEVFLPLLFFGRILKDWYSCFIDSVKLPGPGLLFVERFLFIDPISFYVMSILLHIKENYRFCMQCT